MKLYFTCLFILGFISALFSLLPQAHMDKYPSQLSTMEFKILKREATIKDKFIMFFYSLFAFIIFPPSYLVAFLVALIVNFLNNFFKG